MADVTEPKPISSETLDKHLQYIRDLIVKEAMHLATANDNQAENVSGAASLLREQDIWQAALKFAPGVPFPQQEEKSRSRIITFGGWTNTGVLAVLTFVFGLLGLVGVLIGSGKVDPEVTKSLGPFLDIAKIFAGALVGAAGATGVASSRRSVS
jgi:hypothetical protein